MDDGYWFRSKSHGFGAVPDSWQGWAATAVFSAALVVIMTMMADPARWIVAAPVLVGFMLLCWRKTRGGWHWHWGRRKG